MGYYDVRIYLLNLCSSFFEKKIHAPPPLNNLQEPSEVGLTGLAWLFVSYGYVLYFASNLIGEGSELLLLVPSMAGLVGGVVLPLLGAVPDGGTFQQHINIYI